MSRRRQSERAVRLRRDEMRARRNALIMGISSSRTGVSLSCVVGRMIKKPIAVAAAARKGIGSQSVNDTVDVHLRRASRQWGGLRASIRGNACLTRVDSAWSPAIRLEPTA